MSSSERRQIYCHFCHRNSQMPPVSANDAPQDNDTQLTCQHCGSEFVEEVCLDDDNAGGAYNEEEDDGVAAALLDIVGRASRNDQEEENEDDDNDENNDDDDDVNDNDEEEEEDDDDDNNDDVDGEDDGENEAHPHEASGRNNGRRRNHLHSSGQRRNRGNESDSGGRLGPFMQLLAGLLNGRQNQQPQGANVSGVQQNGNTFMIDLNVLLQPADANNSRNANNSNPFLPFLAPLLNMHGNAGDYVLSDRGFDDVISRLMESSTSSKGTPPATEEEIKALNEFIVTSDMTDTDCAVCKDSVEVDQKIIKLPCKHGFHSECIVQWLKMHANCPVCRLDLKGRRTDSSNDQNNDDNSNNNSSNSNENNSSTRNDDAPMETGTRV